METTFNEQAFLTLSEENQIKVEHIYGIAMALKNNGLQPITPEEFDELYDRTTDKLAYLSGIIDLRIKAKHLAEQAKDINRKGGI